jgi:CTP:phosphocholine cytidylyltransferase-like protein
MELTKTKLNKILKKYRMKLEQHNKEWEEVCRKKCKREDIGDKTILTTPSIYDHERHNSKGAQLFKNLMKEFEGYEVFPKNNKRV